MSHSNDSTSTDDGVPFSSVFIDFCSKVRNDDPSVLPELGKPFKIRHLSEKEDMELADALLENTSVTHLQLWTKKYTKGSAEAMAKCIRASKCLQHIRWNGAYQRSQQREETICCFLQAIQESVSLKELDINFPLRGGLSNLALENVLTRTQSLRSLSLICPGGLLEDKAVAATLSGL
jgi:hypothetical protein